MKTHKETTFEVGHLLWRQPAQLAGRAATLTVVVKGTFDLLPDVCKLADAQALPLPEDFNEPDPAPGAPDPPSVRLPSDFAPVKPRAECLLAGSAYAPGGQPVGSLPVGFTVGSLYKRLMVFGDRQWIGAGASAPQPFTRMPLRLERCFGGPSYAPNPLGVGAAPLVDAAGQALHRLPNIEDPAALLRAPDQQPLGPASAFPIPRTFAERVALAGTFDAAWLEQRWPELPNDFDWSHHNEAPTELRLPEGSFSGAEVITLENLHPEIPALSTRLPGLRPRVLLALSGEAEPRPMTLILDTITVDTDALTVHCTWRAIVELSEGTLDQVEWVYVAEEYLPREVSELSARAVGLVAAAAAAEAIEPVEPPLPPPALPPAPEPPAAAAVLERVAAGEQLFGEDLSGVDLTGANLAGANLAGAILAGANLSGARLDGATLDEAVLANTVLDGASFAGASLRGTDLTAARGEGVCFSRAQLDGALLDRATLGGGARFDGASLAGASLMEAQLAEGLFTQAALAEADFSRALLEGANFSAADLTDATLEGVGANQAIFSQAIITRVRAAGGSFVAARFDGVAGEGAKLREATLEGAQLTGAALGRADFGGAQLAGAIFDGCDLRAARFSAAQLPGARLAGADLFEAMFDDADLTRAVLRGASCFSAELAGATLDGAVFDGADVTNTRLASGGGAGAGAQP